MRKFFIKISIILILNMTPLKVVYSDVFIVAKVNQEIITNIDVDFEKKLHSNHQILETERDKIELKSHEYFLYLEDVIRISDELGFEIVNLYGNYNFEIFNEFSEEMIFICKKKHG